MDSSDAQFNYMLPDIISNFRPKFDKHNLNSIEAASAVEHWLQETSTIAKQQMQQLFDLIGNMQTIQELKTEAKNHKNAFNFNKIEHQLELKQNLDFYEQQYVPLINQRIRNIIQNSWKKAIDDTFEGLQVELQNSKNLQACQIWLEYPNDLPLSLEQALREETHSKHLLMKTKGFSDNILEICSNLDSQLSCIVSEMNVLLEELSSSSEDKLELIEFLKNTAQQNLNEFLSKLKSLHLQPNQRSELLFVVRCCVALFELCPHLKVCFCQQVHWRSTNVQKSTANAGHESWQKICSLFEEEMMQFWTLILDGIMQELLEKQQLCNQIGNETILDDFAVCILF